MTSEKTLHIISFDIPFPPIYGGIIDVFYKIKSLHKLGYKILLHCFQYKGKDESIELEKLCEKVYYYERKKAYKVFFNLKPYIVSSRSNDELLENLLIDDSPIIFEGMHTCFYLNNPALKERNKIVWMHNIEADYYQNLSAADKNFIHKIHFSVESKKLKSFESVLKAAQTIFCVNQADAVYMKQYCENSIFLPAFHLNNGMHSKKGIGDYVLYHGSLDVIENHQAAVYLIETVFSKLDKKVIIAGKQPKSSLVALISKFPHIELKRDLSHEAFNLLIQNAQCSVLYTFQATGMKHKLLNSLYNGRFVIANDNMVLNSGLRELCMIANTPEEILKSINECWMKELESQEIESRQQALEENYSNMATAKKMIPYIENTYAK